MRHDNNTQSLRYNFSLSIKALCIPRISDSKGGKSISTTVDKISIFKGNSFAMF